MDEKRVADLCALASRASLELHILNTREDSGLIFLASDLWDLARCDECNGFNLRCRRAYGHEGRHTADIACGMDRADEWTPSEA